MKFDFSKENIYKEPDRKVTPRHCARMDTHGLPRAPTGHHILTRISGKYINDLEGKHHMLTLEL